MNQTTTPDPSNGWKLTLAWLWVGIPLLWGVYNTILNVAKLFQ
jgi:hypothetical protein